MRRLRAAWAAVRQRVVRILQVVAAALAVGAVLSVLQVASVRWIDPPFTLTMGQRVVERAWAGDGLSWVDQRWRTLDELGDTLPRAVVASEDGRFFVHAGFDYQGICAAMRANRQGQALRGGSTISQQVARNVFLVQRRSWVRKALEAWYTLWLELLVPKERILELYLNVAESGPHVFGFEAAAQHWYGRSARSLTKEQAARLVALLPSPRTRSPQGKVATAKVQWVARNPVPFPGDPGFERLEAAWDRTPWPWQCLTDD